MSAKKTTKKNTKTAQKKVTPKKGSSPKALTKNAKKSVEPKKPVEKKAQPPKEKTQKNKPEVKAKATSHGPLHMAEKQLPQKAIHPTVLAPKAFANEAKTIDLPPVNRATLTDEEKKWRDLLERAKGQTPATYDMTHQYQPKTIIEHKMFGLGYIDSILFDRLEVYFQDGVRHLISNYKKS